MIEKTWEKLKLNKKDKLLKSVYNFEKVCSESKKYYSSRNSPRSTFKKQNNILFPLVPDSDSHNPSTTYVHPQIIDLQKPNSENEHPLSIGQTTIKDTKNKECSQQNRCKSKQVRRRIDVFKLNRNMEKKKSKKDLLSQSQMVSPNNMSLCGKQKFKEQNMDMAEFFDEGCLKEKIKALQNENEELLKENKILSKRIRKNEQNIQIYSNLLQPYQSNVDLMQQKLETIQKFFKQSELQNKKFQQFKLQKQGELDQKHHKTLNYEIQLLKITQQRENQQYEDKINRMNLAFEELHQQLKVLEVQNQNLKREVKCMNTIINGGAYLRNIKEQLAMTNEQLYQYRIENYDLKKEKIKMEGWIAKMKNKISLLTSLIGYGVVTSVENNDICDLEAFKASLNNATNSFQQKQVYDTFGMLSLKKNKTAVKFMQDEMNSPTIPSPCLYLPNFLIFYNDEHLKNAIEDSTTIVIKPQFFLMIRAIFDSKYNQFIIYRREMNKFPDFVLGFIDLFRLKKNQKRIEINPNLHRKNPNLTFQNNTEMAKSSFFIKIFDKKIGSLLEVMNFKEFLFKNIPEDEVFYYLMCRNIILKGSQLNNYMTCCDPVTFVSFEHAQMLVLQLFEKYDKESKILVINHLNTKKVLKNKKIFIKTSYVLKLLLQVYRKYKHKKIVQLRCIIQQLLRQLKVPIPQFPHFFQLLHKNFPYLSRSSICQYYRKTMGIYTCQKDTTFFESLNASCLPDIFFKELLMRDQELKNRFCHHYEPKALNYLLQLVPDTVYQLGSEQLFKQFISLVKLKQLGVEDHIKITYFFSKMMMAQISNFSQRHIYSGQSPEEQQKKMRNNLKGISQIFQEFNNTVIDFFNKNLKFREQYEEKLDSASARIGRFYRRKIKEFYSEFIDDINKQIFAKNPE